MNQLKHFITIKLVFAALAGVFMWSSGFVSDDNIESNGDQMYVPCNYALTRTTRGPNFTMIQETKIFLGTADSEFACANNIRNHLAGLNMRVTAW
jgi:hypothetical protein